MFGFSFGILRVNWPLVPNMGHIVP